MFFFFNDTATTEIYTLSLHDALPILIDLVGSKTSDELARRKGSRQFEDIGDKISEDILPLLESEGIQLDEGERRRSEEHTSELQSQSNLVCRLLLEKKKKKHSLTSRYHDTMILLVSVQRAIDGAKDVILVIWYVLLVRSSFCQFIIVDLDCVVRVLV